MAFVYTYNGETGYTDGTSGTSWQPQNFVYGGRITFVSSGNVDQLGAYARSYSGTRTIKVALYDTSGNVVTSGGTASFSDTTPTWQDTNTFTAASVSAADYIILYSADTQNVGYGYDTANDGSFATEGYATFPADPETITLEGDSGLGYGGRANFTAGGGGGSPPNLLTLLGVG